MFVQFEGAEFNIPTRVLSIYSKTTERQVDFSQKKGRNYTPFEIEEGNGEQDILRR